MTQPGWPGRLTCVIAGEIRRYRQARRISARQLSDKCAALGLEISRSTLADLENGRRGFVTVAEILILAAALDIPPILLVMPVDRQPVIEALPGKEFDPWSAALWLSGEVRLAGPTDEPDLVWLDSAKDDQAVMQLHRRHDQLVDDLSGEGLWSAAVGTGKEGEVDPRATVEIQRELKRNLEEDMRAVRTRMVELGLTPPELPPGLTYLDSEAPQRRRR